MFRKGKITNTELAFKYKVGDSLYDLSEEYESNGTMRFLGMAVILNFLLKNNRFVLIDAVDTSIHYELLAYFLKVFWANSNGTSQMLLTAHDINLLKKSIAIIGEGETEWFYFDSLRVACRYPFKVAPDFLQHSDINHILKLVESYLSKQYDSTTKLLVNALPV